MSKMKINFDGRVCLLLLVSLFFLFNSLNVVSGECGPLGCLSNISIMIGDETPPFLNIISPANNSYHRSNESIWLNHTESDISGVDTVWYYILNSTNDYEISNTTIVGNIAFNVSKEGNYTIYLYANDTSNNINSTSAFFIVDLTQPSVTIISPTDQYTVYDYVSGSVPIFTNFFLTELNPDSCWQTIDGGITNTSVPCVEGYNNFTFSLSSLGTFTLEISANDSAGNENSSSIQIIVTAYTGPQTGGGATIDPSENIVVDFNLYNRTIMCEKVNEFLELRTQNYTFDQRESLKNSLASLFGFGIIDSVLDEYLENFEENCPEYFIVPEIPEEPKKKINYRNLFIFIGIIILLIILLAIFYDQDRLTLLFYKLRHKQKQK